MSSNKNMPKVKTLFIIVLIFCASFAQSSAAVLSSKVTLEFEQVSFQAILTEIERQTPFVFSFDDGWISKTKKLNVSFQNKEVVEVLEELSHHLHFTYKIEDKFILIKRRDTAKINVQQRIISGIVYSEENEPLPGATIVIKGTDKGTTTDFDGAFQIEVNSGDILTVSYIGNQTEEIEIKEQSELSIILRAEVSALEGIVVVGYGTQKKPTITGSVSSIKADQIIESKTANLANNLAGRVAGLTINSRGGEPGAENTNINIRGLGTTGNNAPLVVIDGIPTRGSFERLNPDDIESISVLKDASAAIYGARAANGVILVTTKRGKEGESILQYSNQFSFSQPTRRPILQNALQYLTWSDELNVKSGRPPEFQQQIQDYENGTNDPQRWGDTDWWAATTDHWTPEIQHKLNLSGGTKKSKYYISAQYLDQDAIYKGKDYGYKQYNIRSNYDLKVNKNLKIGLDIAGRLGIRNSPTTDTQDLIRQIFVQAPYELARYDNGLVVKTSQGNPIPNIDGSSGYRNFTERRLDSKFSFDYQIPKIDGLSLSGYVTYDYYTSSRKELTQPFNIYFFNEDTEQFDNLRNQTGNINLFQETRDDVNKTYHLRLNYEKQKGEHYFSGFVAYEQFEREGDFFNASRNNLISSEIPFLFSGEDLGKDNGGEGFQEARQNYFGRINYNFSEKYLAEFTLRYDGSQNFPKDRRFGLFPALSLGWRITEEAFFKSEFITNLKLRLSWGQLGNDRVDNFQYLQFYNIASANVLGDPRVRNQGFFPGRTPNENITWETANKYNIGIDFGLTKTKDLNGSIDLFFEKRSDILAKRDESIPIFTGFSLPDENFGVVENKGIETQLNYRKSLNDSFILNASSQFTFARSKIVFIDEPSAIPVWQRRTGSPVDFHLLYKADGLFQSQSEIDENPSLPGTRPGDVKIVDVSGDGIITDADRILLENSPTPKITYGFSLGFEWKNINFNAFFQGQALAQSIYHPWDLNQQSVYFENRWINARETPNARYPAAFNPASNTIRNLSTIFLHNNAFLKLKNIDISYQLPSSATKALGLDQVNIFFTGHNLLFIYDHVKFTDPESNNRLGWFYPQQRLLSAGINVQL